MDKCERCQNKDATLQCMNCCSFRRLCQSCDSFIHSLPTKKNHTRLLINSIYSGEQTRVPSQYISNENTERIYNDQRENCCNDHEKFLFTQQKNNPFDNQNQNLSNSNLNNRPESLLNNNSNYNPCDNQNQILNNFSNSDNQILNNELPENIKIDKINIPCQPLKNTFSTQPNSTVLNSKLFFADTYTKDYVNELRNVFRKEKEELEFKNKTLQNNLDSLKYKFSEQMNDLTKQLEDIQRNNNTTLENLKNNYEQKLIQLNNEHQIEVDSLKHDIESLEEKGNELNNQYQKDINEKQEIISNLMKNKK